VAGASVTFADRLKNTGFSWTPATKTLSTWAGTWQSRSMKDNRICYAGADSHLRSSVTPFGSRPGWRRDRTPGSAVSQRPCRQTVLQPTDERNGGTLRSL